MCQTEITCVTEEETAVVECRACAMIAAKTRGRRPKHVEGCGYVEPEEKPKPKPKKAKTKSTEEMKQHPRLPKDMQEQIIEGVKRWKKAKKEHAKIKAKYHKELTSKVKKVKPEPKLKVKAKPKTKKVTKVRRLSVIQCTFDKACQVNLDVNGVEIPVFEVEVH